MSDQTLEKPGYAEPTVTPRFKAEAAALRDPAMALQAARWWVKTNEPATGWGPRYRNRLVATFVAGRDGPLTIRAESVRHWLRERWATEGAA